jgi:hypothetical protein
MLDQGRRYDLELLQKAWRLAKTDIERKMIDDAAYRIINQDKWTSSAREALIKQKRLGNTENMKDIREELKKRELKFKGY